MSKQAMQQAIDALESIEMYSDDRVIRKIATEAIAELENALAAPVVQPYHTDKQIDKAARTLAAAMDYPWEHMPAKGRDEMRKHARAVIAAANN